MAKHVLLAGVAAWVGLLLAFGISRADEWGTLKGKFVFVGPSPMPAKLTVNKDTEVCGKHNLVDESIVVGKDGGLGNVLVYLRLEKGKTVAVHPDYAATAKDHVVLDNLHCRFVPRVCLLRTTQTLILKNSDPVGHNTKADLFSNTSFNVLIPAGSNSEQTLTREERLPAKVGCNIHPWMGGYLLVRQDPYMAVSDESGSFEIANLPVGEHEFQFWQEKSTALDVKINGKTAKKGRLKLTVKEGVNDLGEIKVNPEMLKSK